VDADAVELVDRLTHGRVRVRHNPGGYS
jgi:hypothetical protein